MATHIVIPDTQVKPFTSHDHIRAAGRMVASLQPDVVVCLGDWWDFPSLSTYDKGKIAAEGARYHDDVESGNDAMDAFLRPIRARKRKMPRMVFTLGNHEHRIVRHVESNPHLEGKLTIDDLNLSSWEVYEFLKPVVIDGVHYAHYFYNPMSGKPWGGTMQNILNKIGFSFTQGHVQKWEIGRKDLANGDAIMGMIAGAFYDHDERYKGPQGNHHWRGLVVKHNVRNGCYDHETWSIDRLLKEYG